MKHFPNEWRLFPRQVKATLFKILDSIFSRSFLFVWAAEHAIGERRGEEGREGGRSRRLFKFKKKVSVLQMLLDSLHCLAGKTMAPQMSSR